MRLRNAAACPRRARRASGRRRAPPRRRRRSGGCNRFPRPSWPSRSPPRRRSREAGGEGPGDRRERQHLSPRPRNSGGTPFPTVRRPSRESGETVRRNPHRTSARSAQRSEARSTGTAHANPFGATCGRVRPPHHPAAHRQFRLCGLSKKGGHAEPQPGLQRVVGPAGQDADARAANGAVAERKTRASGWMAMPATRCPAGIPAPARTAHADTRD